MGDTQTGYKIVVGLNPGARSGTETGAAIDTSGWDEAIVLAAAGAITAGGTWDLKVQEDTVSNFATVADVAGAALAQFTNATQNTIKTGRLKIEAGRKQFIRIHSGQATQPVAGGVIVMLLRPVATGLQDTPGFDV